MTPHFDLDLSRRLFGLLDPDLVGLPPAFAARVHLHRRGWSTSQAIVAGGRKHIATASKDGQRIRCQAERPEAAWWQVLGSAVPEAFAGQQG
ncbi:hypothetical protein [Tautonia sociabilis]|uniref:Uncharacterized protein n=1 Tax=Tautonia sociabilis TaxID=2080755 RepID=A0A432MQE9_9BACT|nr:hypothetical protein [Tautonia sociabilis]RUL89723.1 hypothetical protein TsocGM_00730 [Tautonia sociabilis]